MPAETLFTESGQPLSGPLLITPQVFDDERGFFYESWNERRFRHDLISAGVPASEAEALQFKQDNHSRSSRGVLRGLHFQLPPEPKGKLVSCSVGGNGERNNYQVVEAICNLMDQLRPQGAPHTRLITMLQPPTRFPALKREQSCTVQTQTDQT